MLKVKAVKNSTGSIYATVVVMFALVTLSFLSSCTVHNYATKDPSAIVQLTKSDFTLSDKISAEATSTKIFSIDWERLFSKKTGNVDKVVSGGGIPIIGGLISGQDETANYALYEIIQKNPDYDVVFYPQYETKKTMPIGLGWLFQITTVKATVRLGKLKN